MSKNIVKCQTLGCKINQCETEKLKNVIEKTDIDNDVFVVNTCCVTNRSEYESRQAVRKAIKQHPKAVIMAVGCAVQKDPASFSQISGVDYVLGNKDKMLMSQIDVKKRDTALEKVSGCETELEEANTTREGRTRAFVKIQDGCNSSCSYCIVPTVRGRSRSAPEDKVLSAVSSLLSDGVKEIVLSGIHLGGYGRELNSNIASILGEIINIPKDFRVRLSSIEPEEVTDDLLSVMKSPKVCPHLHMPMQSGDNCVLSRMNRRYTVKRYSEILEKAALVSGDISIGTDVIVGFPGETEKEFLNTYKFLASKPFSYFHVFRFSKRDGTPAAKMKEQIHGTIKKERSKLLRELSEKKAEEFKKRFIGKTLSALVLSEGLGLTQNYIHLPVSGKDITINSMIPVSIKIKENILIAQKKEPGDG